MLFVRFVSPLLHFFHTLCTLENLESNSYFIFYIIIKKSWIHNEVFFYGIKPLFIVFFQKLNTLSIMGKKTFMCPIFPMRLSLSPT